MVCALPFLDNLSITSWSWTFSRRAAAVYAHALWCLVGWVSNLSPDHPELLLLPVCDDKLFI